MVATGLSKAEGEEEGGIHQLPTLDNISAGPSSQTNALKLGNVVSLTYSLDAFQRAISALGPGVSESVQRPFKSSFSVHHGQPDLVVMNPIGVQSQMS